MHDRPRMSPSDWALLLLLSVLWGASFFFSKLALEALPPFIVVWVRVGIAAVALGAYLRLRRIAVPCTHAAWGAFGVMGLLNNLIPFSLIFWGQTTIASGLASILNATTPIFSLLIAHGFTTDEKLSANKLFGIGLGFAGVIVLVGRDAVSDSQRSVWAMLACLGAALSYGIASIFGRRFRRLGIPPTVGAFGQVVATTIMIAPIALIVNPPWHLAPPAMPIWMALIGLGVLSTAFAYVIYFRLIDRAGGGNASLVTLLIPVSAVFLGSTFLGERLIASQFLGMALIGLGLVAIDGRLFALFERRMA